MQVLFRAKEKNSNNYVIGYEYYNHVEDEYYITHYVSGSNYKVDRTTRSINIEDILDSKGNKIFASLQEDGKGGDILEFSSNYFGDYTTVLYFKNHRLITHSKTTKENTIRNKESLSSSKVIGIQQ